MTETAALRAHHRGAPEVLIIEPAPVPAPAEGEVLMAVHAAAITFAELTWEETWTRGGVDRTPIIPSHEVSGVVADAAPGAGDFSPGDEVYRLIRFDRDGAAAEYVAVPGADLAARPTTMSHVVSAALPLAGLTALQALVDHARLQPGEQVLGARRHRRRRRPDGPARSHPGWESHHYHPVAEDGWSPCRRHLPKAKLTNTASLRRFSSSRPIGPARRVGRTS